MEVEKRRLVAECLAVICRVIMGNQVYNFGGRTFLQKEHGSIGDEAIGAIATLVMIWWVRNLRRKLREVNILNHLLKIYVDDVNGVFDNAKRGTTYAEGKLGYSKEKEERDKDVPEDEITMKIIQI